MAIQADELRQRGAHFTKPGPGEAESMERDEREPHRTGVMRLNEAAREAREASRERDFSNMDQADIIGAIAKLQETVEAEKQSNAEVARRLDRMLYQVQGLVDAIERIQSETHDEAHSAQQFALNGVNRAQSEAGKLTIANIQEVTEAGKKGLTDVMESTKAYIETATRESQERITRLAMITLPDKLFHSLKWVCMVLALFILCHMVWQIFM